MKMDFAKVMGEKLGRDFDGLFGEVVTCDTYKLHQLPFQPDVILDVGANVGVFSRFARGLFPKAKITALEPDPQNCNYFKLLVPEKDNITLVRKALGNGNILFHGLTARNGSGESYLSAGLGYPLEPMLTEAKKKQIMEVSNVETVTLHDFIREHWTPGEKVVLKIDCEGAENVIWESEESMKLLAQMDYIAAEFHFYALTGGIEADRVIQATMNAIERLSLTHTCTRSHINFWALKR